MDTAFGALSSHMAQHLVLMNVVVPLGILLAPKTWRPRELWRTWSSATILQLVLLWGWHSPNVLPPALGNPLLMVLMHFSLVASALWFWLAVLTMPAGHGWRGIFALLITGKLFCLLGALLVFAPNELYRWSHGALAHGSHLMFSGLADQQLAGLMMLIACPLTYVGAGLVIASRWFLSMETEAQPNG
jgi:putative membrane protein